MPADLVTRLLLENDSFDRNLEESKRQLARFRSQIDMVKSSVKGMFAGFAGMAGVSYALSDIVMKTAQFEKSLSSLKALTGLTAQDMDYFKRQAIELGGSSTQTASQVVEAFQLIGSQKPELLKNKEALVEVTKQAIILAEAAGMEVPAAAKALTGSLNQMGKSAESAGEFVNILAAGSQAGSADIEYLTKAIERSGGAANSLGISYRDLVAAIEAIAPKFSEASEAGTMLRNIFLKLESSSDENLRPSIVGLSKALDNLKAKQMDATAMTKMFGLENVTAALAIVNAKEDYDKLAIAITGTNTALEQQAINNNNVLGSLNSLSSAWEKFVLTVNQSSGALKQGIDYFVDVVNVLTEKFKSAEQKNTEYLDEAIQDRKKLLDEEIKGWMVLGDRKKAIMETMRQLDIRSGSEGDLSQNVKNQETSLLNMQMRLQREQEKLRNQYKYFAPPSVITDFVNVSTDDLSESIKLQEQEVFKARNKLEIYKESVKYLKEQLSLLDKTNQVTDKTAGPAVVTDEMKKMWSAQDRSKRFDFFSEQQADAIRLELYNLVKEEGPLPVEIKPVFGSKDEMKDVTGSIADFQQQIQDLTILYNEETNEALRKTYAQRISDLENMLEEMREREDGMLNIADQLSSVIQSGISSSFSALGEALVNGDMLEGFKNMMGSMMDVLQQFGAALIATGVAALALEEVLLNPIAAIAAGGALVIAASIAKAALSKASGFEDGGIVGGNSYTGDNVPVFVNSGEMILNRAQQANLFRMIAGGGGGARNLTISGELVARGRDLVAVISNQERVNSRVR